MPNHLLRRITPEIEPGERLIWASYGDGLSYKQWSKMRRQYLQATSLLSLASVCCFLVYQLPWGWQGTKVVVLVGLTASAWGGVLLLVMFSGVLMGLLAKVILVAFVAIWPESNYAKKLQAVTVYALTDHRAIIWSRRGESAIMDVISYPIGSIKQTHRVESPNGWGDVEFVVIDQTDDPTAGFFQRRRGPPARRTCPNDADRALSHRYLRKSP